MFDFDPVSYYMDLEEYFVVDSIHSTLDPSRMLAVVGILETNRWTETPEVCGICFLWTRIPPSI